jgi:hypothetical protein
MDRIAWPTTADATAVTLWRKNGQALNFLISADRAILRRQFLSNLPFQIHMGLAEYPQVGGEFAGTGSTC